MIDPMRDYMLHSASWLLAKAPTRRRVIHVQPLAFLAPESRTIGGLNLEPAMAYYQYLAHSAITFAHVGQLLSGHGTCTGRELPRPMSIGASKGGRKPSQILGDELRNRFRHALLGACHSSGWQWRKSVGLLPENYTKVQRLFIPWRGDVGGSQMDSKIDRVGNLAMRRFVKSPNHCHRRAIHAQDVLLEVTQYGYIVRLQYGYYLDSSTWSISTYSIPSETFSEFIDRATAELETALAATLHDKIPAKIASESAQWKAHTGIRTKGKE